jgi:N4-gp56 family major capsid protein
MATNSTSNITQAVNYFYDRNMLARAQPADVHGRYGQKRPLPTGNGTAVKFRRYDQLSAATTPLTEGVTPAGSSETVTDITATVYGYGNYVTHTDLLQLTTLDPYITEMSGVLGDQAGTSIDQVRRDVLVAGTNVAYASGVANRLALVNKISATDLDKAIRFLNGQNAKFLRDEISATNKIGTSAVRKAYVMVVHPDVVFDLDNSVTGYKSVSDYSSSMDVMEDEVGSYKNIRFVQSTNAKIWTNATTATTAGYKATGVGSNDVYGSLLFAANAYGVVDLAGNALKTIIKQIGDAGASDPLNQRGSIGWKAYTTTAILNQSWMIRLESLATA